jgi:hypothetical protein
VDIANFRTLLGRQEEAMSRELSLEELWESALPGEHVFRPEEYAGLPDTARRFLEHTIAPGTRLASAVRLRMHGEIKLKGWLPFKAEQVIDAKRGMIWNATVWMCGLPIHGWDRFLDGAGAMRWKLLGLFPVMTASGPDISRSAAGRVQAESVWLPSIFCGDNISWKADAPTSLSACIAVPKYPAQITFALGDTGQVETLSLPRWGNPDGKAFGYTDFGGITEEERTFDGYMIPSRLRIGWYFGTDRFESEGEFFRVTIDEAVYR